MFGSGYCACTGIPATSHGLTAAEAVRRYLLEISVTRPPSAYRPLTPEQADTILSDHGTNHRPPAEVLLTHYLNDWEEFCGAITIGVIDEEYAREMEGTRLIDVFFGYREVINRFRDLYDDGAAKASSGSTAAQPFAHQLYIELQDVALRWHSVRAAEFKDQEDRLAAVNKEADLKRAMAAQFGRMAPKAKDRSTD